MHGKKKAASIGQWRDGGGHKMQCTQPRRAVLKTTRIGGEKASKTQDRHPTCAALMNRSFLGAMASDVTGAVWPLKYRRYWLSYSPRYRSAWYCAALAPGGTADCDGAEACSTA